MEIIREFEKGAGYDEARVPVHVKESRSKRAGRGAGLFG